MTITFHRARRIGTFAASLGLVAGTLLVASPAQAAVAVDLETSATTITEGQNVTLSWTSTDTVSLTAGGSWSGSKTPVAAGDETVTPAGSGTFTYTLLATDENGREATDSVTVTVEPATPADITPAPVTFPDECTVVVPETDNVTYYVSYGGGDNEVVASDWYLGATFYNGGDPVTFFAQADNGFELADGAVTRWTFTPSLDCGQDTPTLVTTTATCDRLTFRSVVDDLVHVAYGSFRNDEPDGEFDLAAGASRTITTNRDQIDYVVVSLGDEEFQTSSADIPQDCDGGSGSAHPTVAPAAGR